MAKEHLIEQLGTLRFTIGTGCSGGSLAQQQIANAYPGVYQGILPQCSFPDSWSTGQQLAAYHLIRQYVEDPSKWAPGVSWSPLDIAAIEGHPNHVNAIVFDSIYWTALADPTNPCAGVSAAQRYDPQTNPGGARCTLADYMINVLGPRPKRVWGPQEKQLGHGFGAIPLSDVGVQFGLGALEDGDITPEQFVDLNVKIGGASIDLAHTQKRLQATRGSLRNAYRSGGVNETNNLAGTAIIDLRGPDPGAFHDAYRSFAMRARLEREQGHFPKNQVIWYGQTPLIGDPTYTTKGLLAMDEWLTAVEKDGRHVSLAKKVASDRPKDVHDRCSSVSGVSQVNLPGVGKGVQERPGRDQVRNSRDGCRRKHRHGLQPLPPGAGTARGLLPDQLHRAAVEGAREGVPNRRLRLVEARCRTAGDGAVADLPAKRPWLQGDLWRATAGRFAGGLRDRLDKPGVSIVARRTGRLASPASCGSPI